MERKVIIAGAGPAGLTAAYELCRRGLSPIVFEKYNRVGGHARTEEFRGYRFDIGGHRFFTKIRRIDQIWHEVLREKFLRVRRLSRIYYNNRFFHYPLKLNNVIGGLGLWNSFMILMSFFRSILSPYPREDNLEEWVSNRFGRRLYRTFFKTYTEKVWGMPCHQIRAEWAAQRIKGLSLRTAVLNAVVRSRSNKIKTLIEEFDYPELGPGMMWEAFRDYVVNRGGQVRLESDVRELLHENGRITTAVVKTARGLERVAGTDFIASIPVSDLIARLRPGAPPEVLQAARGLQYRDFLTVCLIVDHPSLFPDNWIYVHSPEVRMGRLQNFKNWSARMVPDTAKSSLGAEYFVTENDDLWSMSDDGLIALASSELAAIGLLRGARVEGGAVYRQTKAYPVYDDVYSGHLDLIVDYLKRIENLQMVGRNGLHKYNNQDHSMLTALMAVENLFGAKHDIWSVNTDQSYQEEQTEER
ncbi:MAG: NAD(P)/FAD-dependent oxidoreductase [Acidobacteria bacterium]|nr:NAD(P)/FAD-dependent oxidoreductase [Acidobacteriota bacterium]